MAATFLDKLAKRVLDVRSRDGLFINAQAIGPRVSAGIVFVHGFAQCHLSWKRQFQSAFLKDYQLVSYDLRGHGGSVAPAAARYYGDSQLAVGDLEAVLDAAELEKAVLVAWSVGGRIALDHLAAIRSGRIVGVNMVGTALFRYDDQAPGVSAGLLSRMISDDFIDANLASIAFLKSCFHQAPTPDDFEEMLAYNLMIPASVKRLMVGRQCQSPSIAQTISIPMLFTVGRHDRHLTVDAVLRTAKLFRNVGVSIYENAGHAPFFENAARFDAELAAFAGPLLT
ncbi:alpha/beta fold hydrolase [Neorhizobium sp. DT-125]|uniref:alpha/beta fold hydrolase n=1 Tax=Neorhizobium sp. DT-125 TaxID=3396163 RepID=UPI003F194D7F